MLLKKLVLRQDQLLQLQLLLLHLLLHEVFGLLLNLEELLHLEVLVCGRLLLWGGHEVRVGHWKANWRRGLFLHDTKRAQRSVSQKWRFESLLGLQEVILDDAALVDIRLVLLYWDVAKRPHKRSILGHLVLAGWHNLLVFKVIIHSCHVVVDQGLQLLHLRQVLMNLSVLLLQLSNQLVLLLVVYFGLVLQKSLFK